MWISFITNVIKFLISMPQVFLIKLISNLQALHQRVLRSGCRCEQQGLEQNGVGASLPT